MRIVNFHNSFYSFFEIVVKMAVVIECFVRDLFSHKSYECKSVISIIKNGVRLWSKRKGCGFSLKQIFVNWCLNVNLCCSGVTWRVRWKCEMGFFYDLNNIFFLFPDVTFVSHTGLRFFIWTASIPVWDCGEKIHYYHEIVTIFVLSFLVCMMTTISFRLN